MPPESHNETEHSLDKPFIDNLLANGIETKKYNIRFTKESPNKCFVHFIEKSTKAEFRAHLSLQRISNGNIVATIIGNKIKFILATDNGYIERFINKCLPEEVEDFFKHEVSDVVSI